MIELNFENDLVEAIQPIRYFALASSIYHLFSSGIYELIKDQPYDLNQLAETLDLDPTKLKGLLEYCSNESLVTIDGYQISLTEQGKRFSRFKGWYEMFIGGYGNTFLQMGACLRKEGGSATRDAELVGIGSCAISHYDALPLLNNILSRSHKSYANVLDIGCGNAAYLIEFCKYFPTIKATGVEPDKGGYSTGKKLVEAAGLTDRITLINANAIDFFSDTSIEPDLIIISFVLHEILGQSGESAVTQFLQIVLEKFPSIDIAIIEVDNQISKSEIMQHNLSTAYYNPYYLLHYFTKQKLETDDYWCNLFTSIGLDIIAKEYTDPNVDSTKLEICYLLRGKHAKNN
jgi:2-ketoarginine methyltransferase